MVLWCDIAIALPKPIPYSTTSLGLKTQKLPLWLLAPVRTLSNWRQAFIQGGPKSVGLPEFYSCDNFGKCRPILVIFHCKNKQFMIGAYQ